MFLVSRTGRNVTVALPALADAFVPLFACIRLARLAQESGFDCRQTAPFVVHTCRRFHESVAAFSALSLDWIEERAHTTVKPERRPAKFVYSPLVWAVACCMLIFGFLVISRPSFLNGPRSSHSSAVHLQPESENSPETIAHDNSVMAEVDSVVSRQQTPPFVEYGVDTHTGQLQPIAATPSRRL